jgi:F-type H+-transporting ATPase subunit delta
MQEKLTLARPYALAAFAYAEEHGEVDAWAALLQALAAAVAEPQLAAFISHPKIGRSEIMHVLREVLGAQLGAAGVNFVSALLDAERLELAPEIATLFARHRDTARGSVKVEVSSAYPLAASEHARIDGAMRARLGKQCELETSVDPSLIGGAVIKIGDAVIDLSLRGRLGALAQQLG